MSQLWWVIIAVAVVSGLTKAAGPLLLTTKPLTPRQNHRVSFLAPALLAALVVTDTISSGKHVMLDARVVGIAAAAVALRTRRSLLLAVTVAVGTTALVRFLSL